MRPWLLLGLLLVTAIVRADVLHPELVLNNIVQLKGSEQQGDEVYLHVTEFQSSGKNRQYTIPNYPLHWPSSALKQVKDLSVWKQSLQPGDSAEVIISLVEHDVPPWNTDDLIGTAKLRVKNTAGKLDYQWGTTKEQNAKNAKTKQSLTKLINFQGAGGNYQVTLQLLKNNSAAMPAQDKVKTKP